MTSINIRKLSHSEMDLYRKPLLPETWSCFPVDKEIDTQSLKKILQKDLDKIRSGAEKDPFSNSITMLALDISRRLEKKKLNYSALEALIQRLAIGSFGLRADRLKKYIGEVDRKKNDKKLKELIINLSSRENKLIPFSEFKAKIEKNIFGIVLTAHPTFGMPSKMLEDLANMATMTKADGENITLKELKATIKSIFKTEQRPDKNITLDYEHLLSLKALKNLQLALNSFYKQIIITVSEIYPNDYLKITPTIFSLHTWVGYDVDGRGDISWADTFNKRLKVKLEQLEIYLKTIKEIEKTISEDKLILSKVLIIKRELKLSLEHNLEIFQTLNQEGFINNIELIQKISKFMFANKKKLLTDTQKLFYEINEILTLVNQSKLKSKKKILMDFQLLKIGINNFSLGLARTQVRLNANQLNNAISKEIDLHGNPDDPSNKSTYLNSVSKLIDKVSPVKINFGTILSENMNAKRFFMIIAQMFKYIDQNQPVRFLIAECDYAMTALTALYFAKLFNLDEKIDISPLFETEKALANGHLVVETLVKNQHYRKYLLNRGKICIQTGFSDAGRYLGQPAAVLSIENLQRKIAKVLADNNLSSIKLLIFDTHGESIGRGGHPVSLEERLQYINCSYTRKKLDEWNIKLVQEVSFQGGDGYQYFLNPDLSYAALTRIAEFCLTPNQKFSDDILYESPDFGVEFVNTIKQFNTNIMDDPNYAALLNIFGSNILHSSGSRAIKRQNDSGVKTLVYHPSQTRAIPQNSILQQLGMLANSLGGIGKFLRKDPKKFEEYYNKSERFKRILDSVKYAFAFSDIEVLKAYIDCFDPGMWLSWSTRTADIERSNNMKAVANLLESFDIHWRLNKVYRELHQEYMEIRDWVLGRKSKGRIAVGRGRVIEKEIRDELLLMHGIRVAIFHELFLLSVQIPKFSDQAGVSRDEVIAKLIRFDVPEAVKILRTIFPVGKEKVNYSDYGEQSNYISEKDINYTIEENTIFKQLEALHECAKRVSTGITHFIGSVG
jgi:phosphoenolpyruvate carboxylase